MIEFFLFAFTNLLVVLLLIFAARGEKSSGADSLGLFAYKDDKKASSIKSESR